jgi:hypothetical protein
MKKTLLFSACIALISSCGDMEDGTILVSESHSASEILDTAKLIQGDWEYVKSSTTIGDVTTDIKVFNRWTMNFDGENLTEFTDLMGEKSNFGGAYSISRDSLFRDYNAVGVAIKEISKEKLVLHSMNLTGLHFKRVNK